MNSELIVNFLSNSLVFWRRMAEHIIDKNNYFVHI